MHLERNNVSHIEKLFKLQQISHLNPRRPKVNGTRFSSAERKELSMPNYIQWGEKKTL